MENDTSFNLVRVGAALYLRISTDRRMVDNQRLALEAVCEQRGWQITQVYSDNGVSGFKGRKQRPGLDALLKDAARGRFDVALAWALDRLGRSLLDLLDTLSELEAVGVALVLHQQAIDTTTPAGGCSSRLPARSRSSSVR